MNKQKKERTKKYQGGSNIDFLVFKFIVIGYPINEINSFKITLFIMATSKAV